MPFHQPDSIRYFTFDSFDDCGIVHATISRRGGVSPKPWESLNVGGTVGDHAERVRQNRQRTFQTLGLSFESVYDVWQVHGKEVVCTQSPRLVTVPHLQADAILTDTPGVTLFMRFADCVPIFLHDPVKKVIGLVHAGWKGTILRIASRAIQMMCEIYGSYPKDILAGVGPSIASHHYQIGFEIAQQVKNEFGSDAFSLLSPSTETQGGLRFQFDLWGANELLLKQAGVEKIEVSGICTACYLEDWYSHRGEGGQTGRFGALIALS